MKAKILDSRVEGYSTCYLTAVTLKDYVNSLSDDYTTYDIQREIVANSYLDSLVDTVLERRHIPPIVLILEDFEIRDGVLKINSFKILDGLQRTYRLNSIWKTISLFKSEIAESMDILTYTKFSLSRKYSQKLLQLDSSTRVLQSIIDYYKAKKKQEDELDIADSFKDNVQWFEMWSGLSPEEEVSKMLVLNAGHKPVKIKHQLELIFRNLVPLIAKMGYQKFKIVREREMSSIQFAKNRQVGSFHFSHLIAGLLSLKDGKPVTTNSSYIQTLQNNDFDTEKDAKYFEYNFLKTYIGSLLKIDESISRQFGEEGIRWMGREVAIVGMYGALGNYLAKDPSRNLISSIEYFNNVLVSNIKNLNLSNFESIRNQQDISKVNIGNVNKNAVFKAISEALEINNLKSINWGKYFNSL